MLADVLSGVEVCTPLPDPATCCLVPQQRGEGPRPCCDCQVRLAPGLTRDGAATNPEEMSVRFWAVGRVSDISEFLLIFLRIIVLFAFHHFGFPLSFAFITNFLLCNRNLSLSSGGLVLFPRFTSPAALQMGSLAALLQRAALGPGDEELHGKGQCLTVRCRGKSIPAASAACAARP